MSRDPELRKRLDDLVDSIIPAARAQTERLINNVTSAGGTTEAALLAMAFDEKRPMDLRLDVLWLIPRLEVAGTADLLTALLSHQSERIREEAASGLGLLSPPGAVESLITVALEDQSKAVRLASINALGLIGSPSAVEPLLRVLGNQEDDPEVRGDAAEALAHVKDARIVPALMEYLKDGSPLVRFSAAYSLGQQGDPKAVRVLRQVADFDRAPTPWGTVASAAEEAMQAIEASSGP